MLIDCKKGRFKVESNYRDAFRLEAFEEKYIEECFDKYPYIVGDLSSDILRLKGFDNNPKSKNYYGHIAEYLEFSCSLGCPYYVLKRLYTDKDYQYELKHPSVPKGEGFTVQTRQKEPFDRESLILEPSVKQRPKIVINSEKLNQIPKGELAQDLKEYVKNDTTANKSEVKSEVSQSYVSTSPGFVPNQQSHRFNRNRKKSKK